MQGMVCAEHFHGHMSYSHMGDAISLETRSKSAILECNTL